MFGIKLSLIGSDDFNESTRFEKVSELYLKDVINRLRDEFPKITYSIDSFSFVERNTVINFPVIISIDSQNRYTINFLVRVFEKRFIRAFLQYADDIRKSRSVQVPIDRNKSFLDKVILSFKTRQIAAFSKQVYIFSEITDYSPKKVVALFKANGYLLQFK